MRTQPKPQKHQFNRRDFLKVAEQRLNAAEALFGADVTLDAQYVGGYAVECSLKALILEKTGPPDRPVKLLRISSGATMHKPETLLQELRTLGVRDILAPRYMAHIGNCSDTQSRNQARRPGRRDSFLPPSLFKSNSRDHLSNNYRPRGDSPPILRG